MRKLLLTVLLVLFSTIAWGQEPFGRIDSGELHRLVKEGTQKVVIIDTRTTTEYAEAHIEGAVSIPFLSMEHDTSKLPYPKDAYLVFYCTGHS